MSLFVLSLGIADDQVLTRRFVLLMIFLGIRSVAIYWFTDSCGTASHGMLFPFQSLSHLANWLKALFAYRPYPLPPFPRQSLQIRHGLQQGGYSVRQNPPRILLSQVDAKRSRTLDTHSKTTSICYLDPELLEVRDVVEFENSGVVQRSSSPIVLGR